MLDTNLANKLLQMKTKIEEAEKKQAQLQGRIDGVFERLQKDFGIDSLEAADAALNEIDIKLTKKEAALANNIDDLVQKFKDLEVQ
jgi:hypothetical protein